MSIEKLAEAVGIALKQRHLTLVTAESCTGGGLSYRITSIPGSSLWFERGFVTYTNLAKMEMLGIHQETLEKFGAVSEETAREMAEGALHNSDADFSIAVTGIAGPDGGSEDKPVGTVWIAWASRHAFLRTQQYHFTGNREEIREQTIYKALENFLNMLAH